MSWYKALKNRLAALFQKHRLDADMADEMRSHIELRTQANMDAGMNPEAARFAALRQFGHADGIKETCRDQRGTRWLETFAQDIRYGARQLRKSPGFTAVAILSLALGIGAGTAVFSLVNAILLRSLPVPDPQELRVLHWTGVDARMRSIDGYFKTTGHRSVAESVSPPLFQSLREAGAAYADIFAFSEFKDAVIRGPKEAFSGNGLVVSDNFFSILHIRPTAGRLFAPGDNDANVTEVVISSELWSDQFSRNPHIIGQPLTLNGKLHTIIGVLPPGFTGVRPGSSYGFYVLMTPSSPFLQRAVSSSDHWWVLMMARMKSPDNDAKLRTVLNPVFAAAAESQMKQPEILVLPGGGGLEFDREKYGRPLLFMLAAVGIVLLIACANVAGLALARGAARHHELSVRSALGAGRWRLVRQSLVESFMLAVLGGGLGILIAIWGKSAIARLLARSTEGLHYDLSLDLAVLGFSVVVALGTAFLSGLLPALRAGRVDPVDGLKSRTTFGLPRLRTGRALVAIQISLALVLLSSAGLYLQTLANLKGIDAGFETDKLLIFQLNAGFAGYPEPKLAGFYDRAQAAVASIPGVKDASVTVFPLLDDKSSSGGFGFITPIPDPPDNPMTYRLVVGETFFSTLGIPILDGRSLAPADNLESTKVIVVNDTFAKRYFPQRDAVGKVIKTWSTEWRIVGVCGDTKYQNIKSKTPPTVYIPFRQFPNRFGAYFVVRTKLPPLSLATTVRKTIAEIDPSVPVAHLSTQDQIINGTINQERLFASLCGALAGFALLLSCIGLYGLMSFNVTRRTGEIAIRMAIGARAGDVARSILREALILAGIGSAVGLPAAFAVTRLIKSQLFGVQPSDPVTLFVVTAMLVLVAVFAAWLPARRAARVDPIVALRAE